MIYEVRTYTLRPGTVAEFEERYAKRLPLREKHSKLGAFWHTDFGPLNQVVHVYPYDDLNQRTRGARSAGKRPRSQRAPRRPGPDRRAGSRDHEPGAVHAPAGQPRLRHRERVRDAHLHLRRGRHAESAGGVGQGDPGARRSSRPWRPAGRASSAGSTSSSTPGSTRISPSAPASVRNPARPAARGRRRAGCGRSGRKTSC